ncbi:TRASH domain [Sesbania bispinosa]|nr:TRASH domain [Sesbania bispinosa]
MVLKYVFAAPPSSLIVTISSVISPNSSLFCDPLAYPSSINMPYVFCFPGILLNNNEAGFGLVVLQSVSQSLIEIEDPAFFFQFACWTELCRFSGAKIYPGRGIRFIRSDSQVFLFANSKCKRYFHNRLKPSKLTWTAMYRKQHKKDIAQEAVKKRRRATKKPYSRSIVGATLEVIQKKRTEKPEVRDAAREAALREIKERIKKTKDEKKAKKAEVAAKSQKAQGKANVAKGAMPKGPKMGGGGGKR